MAEICHRSCDHSVLCERGVEGGYARGSNGYYLIRLTQARREGLRRKIEELADIVLVTGP